MLDTPYPGVNVELYEEAGWILIQRKVEDGDVTFDQNWAAYSDGFGTASPSSNDNYWLGLEHVYRLLQLGTDRLRIKVGKLFHCVRILSGNVKYRITPLSEGENIVMMCNLVWIQYRSRQIGNVRTKVNSTLGLGSGYSKRFCFYWKRRISKGSSLSFYM